MVLSLFVRAGLNFAGIAALLPLLALLLDSESLAGNGLPARLFRLSGIHSPRCFMAVTGGAVVIFTWIKSFVNLRLVRFENRFVNELYGSLSRNLYHGFLNRGLLFIDREDPLALARKVNVSTRAFASGVLRPAATMVAEGLLTLSILGALVVLSPRAAGIATLLFLPVGWSYGRWVHRRIARCAEAGERARSSNQRLVAESFRGYADIMLGGGFDTLFEDFEKNRRIEILARNREASLRMLPMPVLENAIIIGLTLWIVVGIGNRDSALQFGALAIATLRLMPSVRSMMGCWASIRRNRYAVEELNRASESIATASAPVESKDPLPFECGIQIRDVSFRYPGCDREVLHHLDLSIPKGERLGIQGASGMGKTTLLRLLAGLYEPSQGEIRIDGTLLEAENREAWQRHIGYVSQHPFFRAGSLAENIAPGVSPQEIDAARMADALRTARLEEFIRTLPQGLETPIGTGGGRLSGGQRQRIAIARALYRRADLLLFDESTSSLDPRTERELLEALEALEARDPRLTVVVVAHREESLPGCHRILTLEAGYRFTVNRKA